MCRTLRSAVEPTMKAYDWRQAIMARMFMAAVVLGLGLHATDLLAQPTLFAQPPAPLPAAPDPPERELGIIWSAWASGSASPESLGVSYGRHLSRETALELTLDVGRNERATFGLSTVQLRALPRDAARPLSLVMGLAFATPDLPGGGEPRGFGLLVGGGLHFRVARPLAFRMDAQLLRFRDQAVAGRVLVTTLFGFE